MLEARNLCKDYNDKLAVKDLCISVVPGEVFCLLGQNGAGKTTVINIFLGLIKPSSGQAYINGESVFNNSSLSSKVAYISEIVELYGNLSAIDFFFSLLARYLM